jgi:hypothetical protein
MTDSLERFLLDMRFDLPPGLVDRATAAAAVAQPGALPNRRETVRTGSDFERRRPMGSRTELVAGIAAIVLAAIVIGSFAYVRAITHQRTITPPITSPTPGQPAPRPSPTVTNPLNVSSSTPVILFSDFGLGSQLDGMTWDGLSGKVADLASAGSGADSSNPAGTLFVAFPNVVDRSGRVVAQLSGGPYADQAVGMYFVGTWADDELHYCQVVPIFGGTNAVQGTLQLTTPGGTPRNVARVGLQSAQENNLSASACSVLGDRAVVVQSRPGSSSNIDQYWVVQLSSGRVLWTHDLRATDITRVVPSRDGRYVAEVRSTGTTTIYDASGAAVGQVNGSVEGFSWDGSIAIVVADSGQASLVRWSDGTTVWAVPADQGLAGFQPQPGGTSVAIKTVNSALYVVSSSGRVIAQLPVAGNLLGCLPKQCATSNVVQILPKLMVGNVGWADYTEHTTDGGLHWQDVSPPTPANRTKGGNSYFALDPNHAWVTEGITTGANNANATELVVFGTSDGGQTWSQGSVPISGAAFSSASLDFVDAQRGWLFTDSGPLTYDQPTSSMVPQPITRSVYATGDGGLTWNPSVTAHQADGSTLGGLALGCMTSGLTFTSLKDGWLTWGSNCQTGGGGKGGPIAPVASGTSQVAVTHDGGFSWQPVNLPSYPFAGDFTCDVHPPVFTSNRGVLAVACGGTSGPGVSAVYATSDSGRSWSLRKLPFWTQQVDFVDASNGWTFGATGVSLYRTTDGGKTWAVVKQFAGEQNSGGLSFVDSKVGFALTSRHSADGSSGFSTMWKSTDGGKTWSVITSVPTGPNRCC